MIHNDVCINLCDTILSLPNPTLFLNSMNGKLNGNSNTKSRIYIGSYFCSRYFLQLRTSKINKCIATWKKLEYAVTLVIPVCSEKILIDVKNLIDYMLRKWDICDEIVVNDYGMLRYIAYHYPTLKLTMGRVFFKDARDFRIPELYSGNRKPALIGGNLSNLAEEFGIYGVEFDIISSTTDLSDIPSTLEIGIHTPYCFMTTGMICEFAAIGKDISKKFFPNDCCSHQCSDAVIFYSGKHDIRHFKLGRTVYFSIGDWRIISDKNYRQIYAPFDEIHQHNKELTAYENFGSTKQSR